MSIQHKIVKPRSQRGRRFLEAREPKIFENDKTAIGLRTNSANDTVVRILKDLTALKKPDASFLGRKHDLRPFENEQQLESFSTKYDASLILTGSHNKKRPCCITFARTYDHHILDMYEFCVENFKSISEFPGLSPPLGNKPFLIFRGDSFEHNPVYEKTKTMFIDFFRGPNVDKVRPAGIQHCITFIATGGKILMRTFLINGPPEGTEPTSKMPIATLIPTGPSMDLTPKRTKLASNDLWKLACKTPRTATIKKKKNVSQDVFGSILGRIHMGTQDYTKLVTKKMKGLKEKRHTENGEEESVAEPMDVDVANNDYADIGGDLD